VRPVGHQDTKSLSDSALVWLNCRIPAGDYITRGLLPLSGSMMQRLLKLGRVGSAGLGISAMLLCRPNICQQTQVHVIHPPPPSSPSVHVQAGLRWPA
jgi:hypothetical protein